MACGCRKAQEKQDRIIELNERIAVSLDDVERESLIEQKMKIETDDQNCVIRFIKKFFKLILLQIPLITILMVLVITVLLVYNIVSLIAKVFFNKEIGGMMSPFAIYKNLKNNFIAKSVKNMKEKIEQYRNE